MEWSNYNYLYFSKQARAYLLYSSLSNALVELDENSYKDILLIQKNPDDLQLLQKYAFLLENRFVVASNKSELNKILLSTLLKRFDSKNLSLTIAPTICCNFDCPYCYEKGNRKNINMPLDVQDKIVEFVKCNEGLRKLHVIWYGGEPTTCIDVIRYLTPKFMELSSLYSSYLVTNGYLLDRIVDDLDKLQIRGMQITLDGIKEKHDLTRFLVNGKGTFDRIISNIDLVLEKSKSNVVIRMNVSKENSASYKDLHAYLHDRYKNRVHLYPAFVHNSNKSCQTNICFEDGSEKAGFLTEIYDKYGILVNDIYPRRIDKGCMRQQLNSFVIGPQGELYKCWHHLGSKQNEIGNISDMNILNKNLYADLMLEGDVLFDEKCKKCVLLPSCYGGCTDLKVQGLDYCIPAKEGLEDFLDRYYLVKMKLI